MYAFIFVSDEKITLAAQWQDRARIKVSGSSCLDCTGGTLVIFAAERWVSAIALGKGRDHSCDKWRGKVTRGIKERIMPETNSADPGWLGDTKGGGNKRFCC